MGICLRWDSNGSTDQCSTFYNFTQVHTVTTPLYAGNYTYNQLWYDFMVAIVNYNTATGVGGNNQVLIHLKARMHNADPRARTLVRTECIIHRCKRQCTPVCILTNMWIGVAIGYPNQNLLQSHNWYRLYYLYNI